ncbi:MAG: substrate-binding domain-containing protein [Lachnospiraceae bacterium]
MKKRIVSVLLCALMATSLLAGCGSSSSGSSGDATTEAATEAATDTSSDSEGGTVDYSDMKLALITKSAGNPYNEKEAEGFKEVVEALGAEAIIKHPETASAEAQITMINELVAQSVDSIAIAGNDYDALQPALQAAASAGIKVTSLDSNINPDSRITFVNQAGVQEVAETLMDAVLDISGGSGDWAILSATSQAANQNAWIEAMKEVMTDDKYKDLNLVETAYGDDEYQKSVTQTQALLKNYPDLKVICAPTTVGIMAAAKVLQDEQSSVKLTGLGLPSEMAEFIGDDDAHSCPYMFLWNPIDVGRLSAYTSAALVAGEITGAAGETFEAGDLGEKEIVEASDGGTEIIVGPPFEFHADNIDEWKSVY